MRVLDDVGRIDLEQAGVGVRRDKWQSGTAARALGVEEGVAAKRGMRGQAGARARVFGLEVVPLDGGVLGAEIGRLEGGRVRDTEDVADVKRAVDCVDVFERFRVPDLYPIVLSANVWTPARPPAPGG